MKGETEPCGSESPHRAHEHSLSAGGRSCPGVRDPHARREHCGHDYPHLPHKVGYGRLGYRCPGVRVSPDDRAQPVKARRLALDVLRAVQKEVGALTWRWAAVGQIHDQNLQPPRPRRISEYPENSVERWASLAVWCEETSTVLLRLRRYALTRADEVAKHTAARPAARPAHPEAQQLEG